MMLPAPAALLLLQVAVAKALTQQADASPVISCSRGGMVLMMLQVPAAPLMPQAAGAKALTRRADASPVTLCRQGIVFLGKKQ